MASLQDYSVIKSHVEQYAKELIKEPQDAFYHFVLSFLLDLQEDEIEDAITDNSYLLRSESKQGGHDRGIDAVYIDTAEAKPVVHLFNFKYTEKFEKIENNFPAGEIDKILGFLSSLMGKDPHLQEDINPVLYGKVEEIWQLFDQVNPNFIIHLCANHYSGLENRERKRFEREVHRHSNFSIEYHLIEELVKCVTKRGVRRVDAKLRGIHRNLFEKSSDGDVRALILEVEARDLIRIVLDDEEMRNTPVLEDYEEMKGFSILEDAFEENVRVYLRQRARVNRNIKGTALSDECYRFFYFNNDSPEKSRTLTAIQG